MAAGTHTPTTCDCHRPETCVDRRAGRYLVAAYWLTMDGDDRARTGDLGDRLDVAPGSATEMVERLDGEGLLAYEQYRGARLTERGRRVAADLADRECVVRRFFGDRLDADLDATTAYRIGYELPASGVERLHELVGDGSSCGRAEEVADACCPVARAADSR